MLSPSCSAHRIPRNVAVVAVLGIALLAAACSSNLELARRPPAPARPPPPAPRSPFASAT